MNFSDQKILQKHFAKGISVCNTYLENTEIKDTILCNLTLLLKFYLLQQNTFSTPLGILHVNTSMLNGIQTETRIAEFITNSIGALISLIMYAGVSLVFSQVYTARRF